MKFPLSEAKKPKYEWDNRWRAHKVILNDFTKKFTVISICNFLDNIIKNKINKYQRIQHLSIGDEEPIFTGIHSSLRERKDVRPYLGKILKYFRNLDYVSFAKSNNQLDLKDKDSSYDVMKDIDFEIRGLRSDFDDHVLFLDKNYQGSFDFMYNNLKNLKFHFKPSHNTICKLNCENDVFKSINLFNKINLFKNLEELHLAFGALIDLTNPSLIEKMKKINCKLKKLDITYWGKLRFSDDFWEENNKHINPKPGKWLFTLNKFFDTKEIISLSLNYQKKTFAREEFHFSKLKFEEILIKTNLPKLRNLVLSSSTLDLKSIEVSKLHKLIICTEFANDMYAADIARLYLLNPNLRLSWWPRFMEQDDYTRFCIWDNLQMYTPDYFQIISSQWPSYFFTSDIVSIRGRGSISHKKGVFDNVDDSRKLNIVLKTEYSLEELFGMDLFDTASINRSVLKVIKENDNSVLRVLRGYERKNI
ncbi:uncharacterized protein KGF55_004269 [Candida pseudojiufengensis]|uniref:uncharacterized protein n=1 Tax=Candida pseudojiufengensis TaxID=497109 RepID=UPI0022241BB8|nr:uncharacterized protein KGF55_004269 [Candida pseudojiufengensis]KAI5961002.1 hypothetical protein KGF55_004269 [Candida pseudojiufengensis]